MLFLISEVSESSTNVFLWNSCIWYKSYTDVKEILPLEASGLVGKKTNGVMITVVIVYRVSPQGVREGDF